VFTDGCVLGAGDVGAGFVIPTLFKHKKEFN
jgi:hypothetical protein